MQYIYTGCYVNNNQNSQSVHTTYLFTGPLGFFTNNVKQKFIMCLNLLKLLTVMDVFQAGRDLFNAS